LSEAGAGGARPPSRPRLSRPAAIAALGLAIVLASLGFGTPALMPLGVGLVLLPGLAVAAVAAASGGLRIERSVSPMRVPAGEGATVTVRLTGRPAAALPLLGWSLETGVPGAAGAARPLAGRRGAGEIERSWAIPRVRRGEHRLTVPALVVADPFGLAGRRREGAGGEVLMGLAPVVPIGTPFWERAAGSRRAGSASAAGAHELDRVRDYQAGDPLGRVHWGQTAKRGCLQTKELRGSAGRGESSLLLLDGLAGPGAAGGGEAPFEVAVAAAASLLWHASARGGAMAFEHTGGGATARLPAGTAWPVLERALANMTAEGSEPAAAALGRSLRRAGGLRSVVVVTAAADPALPGAVRAARSRGMSVCCVLAGPAAAGLAAAVRGTGAPVAIATTLADLPEALEAAAGGASAAPAAGRPGGAP
jgi:uncharacterized protein (DUF58 family)